MEGLSFLQMANPVFLYFFKVSMAIRQAKFIMHKKVLFLLLLLGLASCSKKDTNTENPDLIEIRIPDKFEGHANLDSILESVEVKKLDIPIAHFIDNPHYFFPYQGGLIAGDLYGTKKILKMSEEGDFEAQILEPGEGPDKYDNASTVLLGENNNLLLFETFPGRFVQIDSTLSLVDWIDTDYLISNGIHSTKYGLYMFYSNFGLNYPENFRVTFFDKNLKKIDEWFKDEKEWRKLDFKILTNNFSSTPQEDILFYETFQDTVYQLTDDRKFVPKYRIRYPNNQTYEKVIETGIRDYERGYPPLHKSEEFKEYFELYTGFYEAERYIFFNVKRNGKIFHVIIDKSDYKVLHFTPTAGSIKYKCFLPPTFNYHAKKQKFIAKLRGYNLKVFFERGSPALEGLEIEDDELYMISYSFKRE